jgi:nucleosome binding factor SPN SPT16 subunit
LHEMLKKKGLARFKQGDGKAGNEGKTFKTFESYKREEQLPNAIKHKRIYVDEPRNTVVLPIYGFATPFHISTIKNVSKTEEGDYTVLRVNFQSPGQILGRKEDTVSAISVAGERALIQLLASHSRIPMPPLSVLQLSVLPITRICKKFPSRLQTCERPRTSGRMIERNWRTLLSRRSLSRSRVRDCICVFLQSANSDATGRRPHKLIDVHIRPALDAKRIAPGEVELHANGLRYYAQNGNKVGKYTLAWSEECS